MTEKLITADGVALCAEAFGDPADPAVLLISGAAASMDWWDDEFCGLLAARGRFVIRYDHRDTGRSTSSPAGAPTYTADDLTTDPLRVLDGFGVERAHLVGISMGGGIAQSLAARHPDRVLGLTLIATSPAGTRRAATELPSMAPRLAAAFAEPDPEPDPHDRAAVIDHFVEGERLFAGSLGLDEERVRRTAALVVDRTPDVASAANHWSLAGEGSPPFRMAEIVAPTLVLHGTDDPFFPLGHGEALAAEISGAVLVPLPGMGHQVPPPSLWGVVVPAIVEHTAVGAR